KEYRRAPDSLARSVEPLDAEPNLFIPYSDTTSALLAAFGRLNIPAYTIRSQAGDSSVVARGTLVDVSDFFSRTQTRRKSFLISKSSIIGDMPEVIEGVRRPIGAKVVYRDEDRDLVLLSFPRQRRQSLFRLSDTPDSVTWDMVGTFIYSPLGVNHGKVSVIGSAPFNLPGVSRFGYFGAALEERDGNVVFSMVQTDSPAGRANLDAGMRLISLDHKAIEAP